MSEVVPPNEVNVVDPTASDTNVDQPSSPPSSQPFQANSNYAIGINKYDIDDVVDIVVGTIGGEYRKKFQAKITKVNELKRYDVEIDNNVDLLNDDIQKILSYDENFDINNKIIHNIGPRCIVTGGAPSLRVYICIEGKSSQSNEPISQEEKQEATNAPNTEIDKNMKSTGWWPFGGSKKKTKKTKKTKKSKKSKKAKKAKRKSQKK
jgi:hypothetical protein